MTQEPTHPPLRPPSPLPSPPHPACSTQSTSTIIMRNKERHKSLSPTLPPLFLLSPFFFFFFATTAIRHVSASDADVMTKFAQSFSTPPASWKGNDYCRWQGISCDSSNNVISIDISSQYLSGKIPPELNRLSRLRSLSLQTNMLSGPVPDFSGHSTLQELYLDDNAFDSIPSGFLSGMSSLQSISISNNTRLPAWTLPNSLKDSPSLKSISASKSNIVGQIPDIFGSLPSLQNLRLSYNNLTGWLPWSFAKSGIQGLWLNNQATGLTGRLDVLRNMKHLTHVWLQSNQFFGPIPDLSACIELVHLEVRDNTLTGMIPVSLTKLPKLQTVALQNNKFQGPIPTFPSGVQVTLGTSNKFCLATPGPCDPQVTALLEAVSMLNHPMSLADSWEGNNACQQWQYITCEKGSVSIVNFGKQNWTGSISPAFSKLTNLKSLLLNDNRLTGRIPKSLASMKHLETLDVSNNNLSGEVPEFPSSVKVDTSGNPFIGKELPGESSPGSTAVTIVFITVIIVVTVVAGFVIYRRSKHKITRGYKSFVRGGEVTSGRHSIINIDQLKGNARSPAATSTSHGSPTASSPGKSGYCGYDGGNITIPFEVLREATDNFNENNILGRGGFGVVYRGQLHDGTTIAVKRMESSTMGDKGLNEFKAEIEVLTKVRHRHLVALHGFCNTVSERLLVYEYMPQGCLGQHLFHWKDEGFSPLTWNQRVYIALDVARGIEYLHSMAGQSFIHRDLKPSNILLGDDLRAKVSDFGLVRSAPEGNYSVETRLAGTFGYLAPEYAATGRVTTKVDVYAFGVVLMELITGRKALDGSLPDEEIHLVTWFRSLHHDKDTVKKALDPVLLSDLDEQEFQNIWKVVELARHCTARESSTRPDMSHAVNVLSSLVDNWKPSPAHEDDFDIDIHMSLPQALQKWKASEGQSSTLPTGFFGDTTSRTITSTSTGTSMKSRNTRAFSKTIDGNQ